MHPCTALAVPAPPGTNETNEGKTMKLFGKDLYRALALGFALGCAGMALNANGMISRAQAATSHIPIIGHAAKA